MSEREGFTNQKRFVASKEDLSRNWGGYRDRRRFRCYLCGDQFAEGDGVRWVYSAGAGYELNGKRYGVCNLMTCDECDGPDILERWVALHQEFHNPKFWAIRRED